MGGRARVFTFGTPGAHLAETISLFEGAKLIIGPHGAGLAHILFAAPGTAVVELIFMKVSGA